MDVAAIEPLLHVIAEEALLAGVELAALVAAPAVEEAALGAGAVEEATLGAGAVEEVALGAPLGAALVDPLGAVCALLPCVLPSSVLLDCI